MQRFVSHSVQDTEKIAAKLAEKLKGGEVIAFTGPMGMGKTAFTRGLVLALGGGDVVSSPTFALVNEYDARLTVQHFDMYRVSGWDDLYSTAFSITSIRTTCSSLSGAKHRRRFAGKHDLCPHGKGRDGDGAHRYH